MKKLIVAGILAGVALAAPRPSQAQNLQQMLGGLLTGNPSQDNAIRDAYERGYQRGREDEARMRRGPPPPGYGGPPPPPPYDPYRR